MINKIYAIPLKPLDGFGYVQVLNNPIFGSNLRVFDLFTQDKLKFEEVDWGKLDELCYMMALLGNPRTKKYKDELLWYELGEAHFDSTLCTTVDFKMGSPPHLINIDNWQDYDLWYVMIGNQMSHQIKEDNYDKIKHLSLWMHSNYLDITQRITMFWIKKLELNCHDFFHIETGELRSSDQIYTKLFFLEVENTTLYNQLPKTKWNRIL
jgi:hypothetical protein